ncbi:hypothetical protein AAZV13_05G077160 [Glycine max]
MSFKATNDTWDVLYEVAGQVVRLKMKDLVFLKFDFQNSGVLGGFPPPVAAKNAFFPNQGVSQVIFFLLFLTQDSGPFSSLKIYFFCSLFFFIFMYFFTNTML